MYTDPRHTYEYFDTTPAGTTAIGIDVQVEQGAAILGRVGRHSDNGAAGTVPAGSAARDGVRCPTGALIESFGVTITEALTNANATHCIIALKFLSIEGATAAAIATLTLPKDSTEVIVGSVSGATVVPASATATQAVAVGARIIADGVKGVTMGFSLGAGLGIPFDVPPGGIFFVEVVQAALAVGGAFRAFVVCQHKGQPAATSASPVTRVFV